MEEASVYSVEAPAEEKVIVKAAETASGKLTLKFQKLEEEVNVLKKKLEEISVRLFLHE